MELFKISGGPWEKLFTGLFQEHEIELYSNPDRIILVIIYEKKLDQIVGAVVELYKVFYASGDAESFTETLPREAMLITKHDESQNLKFLLLGSKPVYIAWSEEEFTHEVDSMVKRLEASALLMFSVKTSLKFFIACFWF